MFQQFHDINQLKHVHDVKFGMVSKLTLIFLTMYRTSLLKRRIWCVYPAAEILILIFNVRTYRIDLR